MRTALFILTITSCLSGQQSTVRQDIRELIAVSGGQNMMDEIFSEETIQKQMRALLQNTPPAQQAKAERFIREFSKEFLAESRTQRDHLVGLMIEVYAKYYTPEDVQALIAFYRTPAGKKLAAVGPKAAVESMQVGQKWGQELGAKIGARVGARIDAESKEQK